MDQSSHDEIQKWRNNAFEAAIEIVRRYNPDNAEHIENDIRAMIHPIPKPE